MSGRAIDVASLIDDRPLGGLQIRVFALCALVAVLDGIDSQAIGVAGPLMASEMGMRMSAFAPVISAGLFGATIGALTFGPIGDRLGRRPTLVGAAFIFALFTLLTPFADTLPSLVAVRFVAGLGLGGATPCFITLTADYAPRRQRAMLASLMWSAYPLGNAASGFITSYLVGSYDWRMVFFVAGVPSLVVAVLLLLLLPESLRFLTATGKASARAQRIARQLDPGLPAGPLLLSLPEQSRERVRWQALFSGGQAVPTLLLWVVFFMAFGTTTLLTLWTPTLLRTAGIPLATAASLVGVFSIAAVIGMAVAGKLVQRFGAAAGLVPAFLLGAVLLVGLGWDASSVTLAAVFLVLLGLTVPLGAAGGIAVAATYYPAEIRTSGVGWAMGLGRFGQVCTPLLVGLMLAASWSPSMVFTAMATLPVLAGVAMLARSLLLAAPGRLQGQLQPVGTP